MNSKAFYFPVNVNLALTACTDFSQTSPAVLATQEVIEITSDDLAGFDFTTLAGDFSGIDFAHDPVQSTPQAPVPFTGVDCCSMETQPSLGGLGQETLLYAALLPEASTLPIDSNLDASLSLSVVVEAHTTAASTSRPSTHALIPTDRGTALAADSSASKIQKIVEASSEAHPSAIDFSTVAEAMKQSSYVDAVAHSRVTAAAAAEGEGGSVISTTVTIAGGTGNVNNPDQHMHSEKPMPKNPTAAKSAQRMSAPISSYTKGSLPETEPSSLERHSEAMHQIREDENVNEKSKSCPPSESVAVRGHAGSLNHVEGALQPYSAGPDTAPVETDLSTEVGPMVGLDHSATDRILAGVRNNPTSTTIVQISTPFARTPDKTGFESPNRDWEDDSPSQSTFELSPSSRSSIAWASRAPSSPSLPSSLVRSRQGSGVGSAYQRQQLQQSHSYAPSGGSHHFSRRHVGGIV